MDCSWAGEDKKMEIWVLGSHASRRRTLIYLWVWPDTQILNQNWATSRDTCPTWMRHLLRDVLLSAAFLWTITIQWTQQWQTSYPVGAHMLPLFSVIPCRKTQANKRERERERDGGCFVTQNHSKHHVSLLNVLLPLFSCSSFHCLWCWRTISLEM